MKILERHEREIEGEHITTVILYSDYKVEVTDDNGQEIVKLYTKKYNDLETATRKYKGLIA